MSLLVVGSIALDTIRTPDGKEYPDVLGGSCTYFAYAASFFDSIRLVSIVGDDFSQDHVNLLKSRKIDIDGLEIRQGGKTFRWAGTYAENMNDRTTDDLQFGVLGEFNPQLPQSYRDSDVVFLACAQPALQLQVMDQMEKKPLVVFDTIEFYIENDREMLGKVFERADGVIINDSEVKMLTGDSNLVRSAKTILDMGPRFAVLKKGEHGGILATREGLFPFPAYPLAEVADPTGAGDTFAAGFMGYLAKTGKSDINTLRRATVYGTVMASYTCEGISLNRLSKVTDEDIEKRAADFAEMLRIPE